MESRESRAKVRDFRDLLIWQRAMNLARCVYQLSAAFPPAEQFGLTAQVRRSAVSVVSNIAEGHGRETPGDFGRFLRIARGSLAELHTQVMLAEQLGFITSDAYSPIGAAIEELSRMLRGMQKTLDSKLSTLN